MRASPALVGVVDVETTGLFPSRHDRIVEMAAVVVDLNGEVHREFVTLVNPLRDIGPTRIHGLTTADVINAPSFAEVVRHFVVALTGTVALAGHNLRFDRQFLESEFARMSCPWPICLDICTMSLAGGGSLRSCCDELGISFDGESHSALADARATARLLSTLLSDYPDLVEKLAGLPAIQWPNISTVEKSPVTRGDSRGFQAESRTYLQKLLQRLPAEPLVDNIEDEATAYCALLDRVIEDRRIDDCEAEMLIEAAEGWQMTRMQVQQIHERYVDRLVTLAVVDADVTAVERRDLEAVRRMLGDTRRDLDTILANAIAENQSNQANVSVVPTIENDLKGKCVCFTGEMRCTFCGRPITREIAESMARNAGLEVAFSVTKKLDVLVVADPLTQSGKARKARQYGIRVLAEPVFWGLIGVVVE